MRETPSRSTPRTWRTYGGALVGPVACAAGTVQLVAGDIPPWLPLGQIAFDIVALGQSVRSFRAAHREA